MPNKQLDKRISSLTESQLFLATLFGEARGESVEGQIAVAHVIRNRLVDGRWGLSYHDVLGRWAQFSCLWAALGGMNHQSVLDFATVLHSDERLPGAQGQLQKQLEWVMYGVFKGALLDNTHGSTHYFATWINPPFWAKEPAVRMATIGRHEFWRGVA